MDYETAFLLSAGRSPAVVRHGRYLRQRVGRAAPVLDGEAVDPRAPRSLIGCGDHALGDAGVFQVFSATFGGTA
ncbi:MAG: hypothetical protein JWQ48_3144 [Conexibacter sp.]|nr:hypothetical protein [Conexibacter sp.]